MTKIKLILTARPLWVLPVLVIVALIAGIAAGVQIPLPPNIRGPLVDINDGILIAFIVALGGILAQLYSRVGKLEERIGAVEAAKDEALDKLTAAASFINRIGLWLAKDQRGEMPQPPEQILPHLDAELWPQDAVGGTD